MSGVRAADPFPARSRGCGSSAARWVRFSWLLALVGLVLFGCRREAVDASGHGPVRLRVWSMWGGDEAEAFQVVVDYFNKTHPGIRLENLSAVKDDKTIRAIVAGDPPEIFTLADPGYLGSLAANGALQNLDARYASAGLKSEAFAPGTLSQCRYHGHLYAAIYLVDCFALLWNPDAFAAAGLPSDHAPRTTEELVEAARKLTRRGSAGRIEQLGILPPDPLIVTSLFGGKLVDPASGRPTADDPRNREAFEWYRSLITAQGDPAEVNAFSSGFGEQMGINNPFLVGKVAMMFNGQWNPYWFQRYGPKTPYRVSPLPYPAAHPELKGSTWLGGNLFCIPVGCRHPAEAWEFLSWTQTREAQVLFASTMHGVPNLLSARTERSLRTGERWKEAFGVFMDVATSPNAHHFPVTPVSGLYQNELTTAADYVRFGNRTPEQALGAVEARVGREARRWE